MKCKDLYIDKNRGVCVKNRSALYKHIHHNVYKGMFDSQLLELAIKAGMETNNRPSHIGRIAYFLAISAGIISEPQYCCYGIDKDCFDEINIVL